MHTELSPDKTHPTILVVFGATGDLMMRKIIPALFELSEDHVLPQQFRVVGFARRPLGDSGFRTFVTDALRARNKKIPAKRRTAFTRLFEYHQGTFEAMADYHTLANRLQAIDAGWSTCANKLFYLSVPPEQYEAIIRMLDHSQLTDTCGIHGVNKNAPLTGGWTRVIVEKPFGKDYKTAEKLDLLLGSLFQEQQIYRIDHYLGKEMSQNLLSFRFSNNLFEDIWNNRYIEKIEIRGNETLGVEKRGAFYDGVGALRDFGQNHLLQLVALLAMDVPKSLRAEHIRERRAEILQTVSVPSIKDIRKYTFRAQYAGYRSIDGVAPRSQTETYFKSVAFLRHSRWKGVPFILETGKRMQHICKEIVVTLRHLMPCLCPPDVHYTNTIIFRFEPKEEIIIDFWAKKPGYLYRMEPRTFDFSYRQNAIHVQYVEEYKKMLFDCIQGDQMLFVSTDEMKAMWKYADPILKAWKKGIVPLDTYTADTNEAAEKSLRVNAALS